MLKKIIFWLILIFIPVIFIELFLRLFFAVKISPNIIFYGTNFFDKEIHVKFDPKGYYFKKDRASEDNIISHDNYVADYSKYRSNENRTGYDENDQKIIIKINNMGFRGNDFIVNKKDGIIRIVTLGGSSTFGYKNKDDETYPYYIQTFLNEKLKTEQIVKIRGFEVLNLGIPHLKAKNIYSLFMNEALKLNPDVVIFYEGMNDAAYEKMEGLKETLRSNTYLNILYQIYWELRERLILLAFISNLKDNLITKYNLPQPQHSNIDRTNIDIRNLPVDKILSIMGFDYQDIELSFFKYLGLINDECNKRGIIFIIANQEACSATFSRDILKKLSYDDELIYIKKLIESNKPLTTHQMYFLKHAYLMTKLQEWAFARKIPFVDIINALNNDRDTLLSWVHLSAQGNRLIARQFAEKIYSKDIFPKIVGKVGPSKGLISKTE